MKDELKRLLTPVDDGRAFTDAVLLRASGALHRRRAAAQAGAAQLPALEWLAQWARPWLVAALVAAAALAVIPALPRAAMPVDRAAAVPADSDALVAALLPADLAVAAATDRYQER